MASGSLDLFLAAALTTMNSTLIGDMRLIAGDEIQCGKTGGNMLTLVKYNSNVRT